MKWLPFLFILAGCSGINFKSTNSNDVKAKITNATNTPKISADPTLSNSSFKNETEFYGLGHLKAANFFVIDYNEDGYSDIVYLPEYFSAPKLLIFSPKEKKFSPAKDSPFEIDMRSHYLLFYDFTNDGILDVVSGALNQKTEIEKSHLELYVGVKKEGRLYFEKKAGAINVPAGPHATVIPVDFDLDGDLDLFVGNWFDQSVSPPKAIPDLLLQNNGGVFSDASKLLSQEWKQDEDKLNYIEARPTYAASTCDVNQDGQIDIMTASTNGHGNKLWINSQTVRSKERFLKNTAIESRFSSDSEGLLTSKGGGRTFSVLCADYNNDSIMDVFVGEVYHNYDPESVDRSSILTGSSTKNTPFFMRTEYTLDSSDISWHQADRRSLWFDYNLDGLLDLLIDNSGYPPHTRMVLFEQLADHSFINRSSDLGLDFLNPNSSTLIDVNQDGKWDILSASTDVRDASLKNKIFLLVNNHPVVGKSLKLHLRGDKSNRLGVGATVILKLSRDGKYYQRIYNVQYSQGGLPPQNEESLIVAIAPGESLRQVVVRWPYSKDNSNKSYHLEKSYKFKEKIGSEYTLCETGYYVKGRKRCTL